MSEEDKALLETQLTADVATSILDLHARALQSPNIRSNALGQVKSGVLTDRELRTTIHQTIRRVFAGRIESSTDQEGCMVFTVNPPRKAKKQRNQGRGGGGGGGRREIRGKLGWAELGGEYLHFTLYKENKDTMEVISFLARQMKMNPKSFQFAGTKDRRGVTAQRACVYRVHADRLAAVNKTLRSAVVGDFEYKPHGLELGDLSGNEFVITLRDCKFPQGLDPRKPEDVAQARSELAKSMRQLSERGYFNYYGLQRFGTFATRTDQIGLKMLQGDFEGAVEAILEYPAELIGDVDASRKVGTDDIARARAIHIFKTTGKANAALDLLPRKFSAESNIIRHLGRARKDYMGALQAIPRNLRLMYVHAYQSLVWNFAVGERWRLYGDRLVEGDLVLLRDINRTESSSSTSADTGAAAAVDADGEVVVLPDATDAASTPNEAYERARPLTAEEAASGKFSIFDLVLPLPGFDVVYPANAMKDFYATFMGSDRGGHLDPLDMRRSWKDISLSGGYRKVLSRPGPHYDLQVRSYTDDNEQFVTTDLQKMRGTDGQTPVPVPVPAGASESQVTGGAAADPAAEVAAPPAKLAVILTLQLGTSQYATMALRELMKTGGVKTYKPDFGGGR
ncbi:hypothetical protein KEM52_005867 [Ascosphaera acerosa]|nr:hypothetical protein KEM52_005867 [Ascosphaera acerosa]